MVPIDFTKLWRQIVCSQFGQIYILYGMTSIKSIKSLGLLTQVLHAIMRIRSILNFQDYFNKIILFYRWIKTIIADYHLHVQNIIFLPEIHVLYSVQNARNGISGLQISKFFSPQKYTPLLKQMRPDPPLVGGQMQVRVKTVINFHPHLTYTQAIDRSYRVFHISFNLVI